MSNLLRSLCTHSAMAFRHVTLRLQAEDERLQEACKNPQREAFQKLDAGRSSSERVRS